MSSTGNPKPDEPRRKLVKIDKNLVVGNQVKAEIIGGDAISHIVQCRLKQRRFSASDSLACRRAVMSVLTPPIPMISPAASRTGNLMDSMKMEFPAAPVRSIMNSTGLPLDITFRPCRVPSIF
jgi:hypothetical protein